MIHALKLLLSGLRPLVFTVGLLAEQPAFSQPQTAGLPRYLEELQTATAQHKPLWNKHLYGPLLLVDPATRTVIATTPDAEGKLTRKDHYYIGTLPPEVNLANTAMRWAGTNWAMVKLPLPQNKHDRLQLLTHELFHLAQPKLGLQVNERSCDHLDQPEGRIWLRLEVTALQEAAATKGKHQQQHLRHALLFRQYRHQLFPGADSTENLLELNEGLAEYTGLIMSGRSQKETLNHLKEAHNRLVANSTFTRSFAYQTIPIYGYLLYQANLRWQQQISRSTNLTRHFLQAFGLAPTPPSSLAQQAKSVANQYNGQVIFSEEKLREEKRQQQLALYKTLFLEQPHIDLPLEQMNISFDPATLTPLPGHGTVYPTLRITDKWGILTVEKGALVASTWDKVTLSAPTRIESSQVTGEGWVLELKEPYKVQPVSGTAHFTLRK